MILILFITFLSGSNYFVLLLFWPTENYNVYGRQAAGFWSTFMSNNSQATTPLRLVYERYLSESGSSQAHSSPLYLYRSPKVASD